MNNIDLLITLTQHERDSNNVTIAFTMGLKAAQKSHNVVDDIMAAKKSLQLN